MDFAQQLAALNEWHFFSEFTYSKTKFRPEPRSEVELADAVIWIGSLLVIFQVKEREQQKVTTGQAEQSWFDSKVLKKAVRQVRDTLAYLRAPGAIEVCNHRGHALTLDLRSIGKLHKLIVYLPSNELPVARRRLKHYRSRTAGLIHIIPADGYLGIVRTLLTPAEVVDYLTFREAVIDKWETEVAALPEQALVGQYLGGDLDSSPSLDYANHLQLLDHRVDEWDISGIISKFVDPKPPQREQTYYYPIIRELALLKRNELREFKTRFKLAVEKARANQFVRPYRIAFPRTGCGFVFVPVTKDSLPHRRKGLQNFTLAHKYEVKLTKCVGVSIADGGSGWFTEEWFYTEFPWEHDSDIEGALQNNYPFHKIKEAELPRYTYKDAT